MLQRICRSIVVALTVVCFLFTSVIYAAPIGYGKAAAQDKLRLPLITWKVVGNGTNDATGQVERKTSLPVQIRTELKVPEGQPENFFTTDYHEYTIAGLFNRPIAQIPDEVTDAIRAKLALLVAEKKLKGAVVRDFGATEIDLLVTHSYGDMNAAVQRLMLEAFREGCL